MKKLGMAVLTAALVLLAGCGGGATEVSVEASPGFLAEAAARTADARSARIEMLLTVPVPEVGPVEIRGHGAFDGGDRYQMTMDMSSFADAAAGSNPMLAEMFREPVESVGEGTMLYMRFPLLAMGSGADTDWVSWDMAEMPGGGALTDQMGAGAGDPTAALESLRGVTDVQEAGIEQLDGVTVTRMTGTFTVRDVMESLDEEEAAEYEAFLGAADVSELYDRSIDFDVWVDEQGLIRRFAQDFPLPTATGSLADGRMDMRFFDFGADLDIELPDPGEVTDITEVMREHAGG